MRFFDAWTADLNATYNLRLIGETLRSSNRYQALGGAPFDQTGVSAVASGEPDSSGSTSLKYEA